MIALHWWQVCLSLFFTWFCGFLLGIATRMAHSYQEGRRDMADEIEDASGMHDAVCTCISTPGVCVYHGDLTAPLNVRLNEAKEKRSQRTRD